jgi:endonuclease/exonuclease/phosphatase family metal-dependent hydrolase
LFLVRPLTLVVSAALVALGACREPPAVSGAQPTLPPAGTEADAGHQRIVRVVAKNRLGVPLHPEVGSSGVSGRLADRSEVRVLRTSDDGRWYEVRAPNGESGWITRRYVEQEKAAETSAAPSQSAPRLELPAESPWASAESCRRRLAERKTPARAPGSARIATWNLKWFPDGGPGKRPNPNSDEVTDLDWLACAIAWLDVDIVVLQEIKLHADARASMVKLRSVLDRLTGGRWQAEFDRCPIEPVQHVGFLFDEKRVSAQKWNTYPSFNPHGQPCKDQLRPGFGGYFRFRGGFDTHVIAAHLKSGGEARSFELRAKSFEGAATALSEARALVADDDVLVVGDLNTMGCPDCSPPVAAAEELLRVEKLLGAERLRRVEPDAACSEYFQGRGALLDHFLVSPGLRELPRETRARVSGFCAETACRALGSQAMPTAHRKLSDHCPLVLELLDKDLD